jgi:O-antigen ligase
MNLLARAAAIAWFFLAIGCYTLLAPIDGPSSIGAPVLSRSAAIVLAASLVIAALVAAASLRAALDDDGVRAARPVLGLWLGALIVAGIFSFLPGRSWSFLALAILSAAGSLALVRWWRVPVVARALVRTYLWGGLVLVAVALLMDVTHRPESVYAANLGRATGLFVTPNQFAAWLVPFLATASGVALAARTRGLRLLAAGGALLAAIDLAATFSLGGWLGGCAALLAALWWLGRRRVAALGALIAVALVAIAIVNPAVVRHRQSERFVRFDAIRAGMHMAALFPLTGVGPLAYPRAYPLVRVPSSTEDAAIAEHPHDVTISLLAETGLAGLAAIVAGWILAGRAIVRGFRRATPQTRTLIACIAAGIAGRFVHGFVDLVGALELAYVWFPFAALLIALARDGIAPEVL